MSLFSFLTDKFSARAEKQVTEQAEMLEKCWKQRDEEIYPSLFGKAETDSTHLTEELFREEFGRNNIHPFWLHHSVLNFPPEGDRKSWLYATSGLSNAWDGLVDEYSGLGIELIIECGTPNAEAKDFLAKLMAYNLLLAMGHYKDKASLALWDIIPLEEQEPLLGVSHILLAPPKKHPAEIQLLTGKSELLQIYGVSAEDAASATETNDAKALYDQLQQNENAGIFA